MTPSIPKYPSLCLFQFVVGKDLDFSRDKMTGYLLGEFANDGICDKGHVGDFLVVVLDEIQMGEHCGERIPAGKRLRVNDNPV